MIFMCISYDVLVTQEECGAHEFQCDNKICVSVDSVCDNHNDCSDFSDERDCRKSCIYLLFNIIKPMSHLSVLPDWYHRKLHCDTR